MTVVTFVQIWHPKLFFQATSFKTKLATIQVSSIIDEIVFSIKPGFSEFKND